ncbi:MAG: hypothetical protein ACJ8E7_11470 [Sphingomicrobium sp.]
MDDDRDQKTPQADDQIEEEIRRTRKFSASEAMARLAGPGAMKGASPVSPVQQAETEIGSWLMNSMPGPGGALAVVLGRQLKGSKLLLENLDEPLGALAEHCRHLIASDYLLTELVREADVEWGRVMDERPHFDREGAPPSPDDPYTAETVRNLLGEAITQLAGS